MKSEVYSNSSWTTLQVAYLYYEKGLRQKEIGERLGLSGATVSRLLGRAREEGMVEISIPESYTDCIRYSERIRERYGIEAIVVNTKNLPGRGKDPEENKKAVARDGARYVQKVIMPNDILGIAWGGTMYHLIHFLNPCQKTDNAFITLHGSLDCCDYELDVDTLVRRMAMAMGGSHFELRSGGLLDTRRELEMKMQEPGVKIGFEMLEKTTISVSGFGAFEEGNLSPLSKIEYLKESELEGLRSKGLCMDLMLRFFNGRGEEIESDVRNRTLSIGMETYKKIPTKIIVGSGVFKAKALRAVLLGGYATVVVVDDNLAKALLELGE